MTYHLIDKNNPVFSTFIVWSSVLVIKFLLMATLTSIHRFRTHVGILFEIMTLIRNDVFSFFYIHNCRQLHHQKIRKYWEPLK